jgi:hypothetical protein
MREFVEREGLRLVDDCNGYQVVNGIQTDILSLMN